MRFVAIAAVGAVLVAACASNHDARLAAFGASAHGDLQGASEALTDCLYTGSEGDQFLCRSLFADVRYRQGRWREAASMYRSSFELRDRIAKREGYGTPSLASLVSWGWALVQATDYVGARAVLQRAAAQGDSGEGLQWLTLIHLALAEIAAHEGDAATAASEKAHAIDSCTADHLEYFTVVPTQRLANAYLPVGAWIAMGDVCGRTFYEHARDQARIEHDVAGEQAASHRLGP